VNTSRGAVVDELALADALTSGSLFAAGLDVYEDEPNVSPQLLAAPRTVLLPHIGSATLKTREAMLREAARKVEEFFKDG
jgi:glyoxylate reductase